MPSPIRSILYRTIFSDINSVTEQDMAAILFGIYKDVYVTEHEFYEPNDEKQFWVHKMDEDNKHFNTLVSFLICHVCRLLLILFLCLCCYLFDCKNTNLKNPWSHVSTCLLRPWMATGTHLLVHHICT
jgi:hypothetical protein